MKPFLSGDFLLQAESAQRLYHEYAAEMPIFDCHGHLPVAEPAASTPILELLRLNWPRK